MERNRDQERGRYPGYGRNYSAYYEDQEPGYYGDYSARNRGNYGNRYGREYDNDRNYRNENRGYSGGRDRDDDRNWFDRAGDRIRDTWNDLTGRDEDNNYRSERDYDRPSYRSNEYRGNYGNNRYGNQGGGYDRDYGTSMRRSNRDMENDWRGGRMGSENYGEPRGYGNRAYGEPDRYYDTDYDTAQNRNRNRYSGEYGRSDEYYGRNRRNNQWSDREYDF